MSKFGSLSLYFKPTCPFCQKVLDYLEKLNRKIDLKDIKDHPENLEALEKLAGKKQVPCLVIDNEPMHESDAIILWIEEHKSDLKESHPGMNL